MTIKNFTTRSLNISYPKDDPHKALQFPIYESVAYEFDSAEDIAANFRGELPAHVYARTGNPTAEYLEKKIRELTGSHAVLAVSSGMAAISDAILTLCKSGDKIVSGKHLFGHTYALLEQVLNGYGVNTEFVDICNPAEIEAAIDKNTRVIYFETVTNPQLEIADIEMLASIAKKHKVALIADSTVTPPNVFNSKKHGVDIEVMSTTKFISGGATSVGGLVIDNGTYDWSLNPALSKFVPKLGKDVFYARMKKSIFRNTGSAMTAHAAYFQILGLDILELRMEKCVDNCMKLSAFMEQHPKIKSVNYPGLKNSPYHEYSKKYFNNMPGAIITFDLESEEACFAFMNRLKIIRRATNLNDNKSLIIHPYSTIYVEFSEEERASMNIRPTMMRLSVGIEGIDDLTDDINVALK